MCGRPVPAGAAFCPACGASTASPLPPGNVAPTWAPPSFTTPALSPVDRGADRSALRFVLLAAVLILVGTAVGYGAELSGAASTPIASSNTSAELASLHHLLNEVIWDAVVGFILTIAALLCFRLAFQRLAQSDNEFSWPAIFAIVALAGVVLLAIGLPVLVQGLENVLSCANGASTIPASCLQSSSLGAGAALIVIGAIGAIVGYIGLLIGIYRLGRRYDDGLFKLGAILMLLPLVSVIGAILVLVGAVNGLHKIGQRAGQFL